MDEKQTARLFEDIGEIKGSLKAVQSDTADIKGNINELYTKFNGLNTRVTALQTEHDSMKTGNQAPAGCGSSSATESWQSRLLNPKLLIVLVILALAAGTPSALIYMVAKGVIK
jgi:hypothetical protein